MSQFIMYVVWKCYGYLKGQVLVMNMNDLNEDMLDVLEMREKQLTEMIRMLQKKRRNVREFIARYNAKDLKPVPNSVPVAESAVAKAEEVSGGNKCTCSPYFGCNESAPGCPIHR